jgi:hypothetical protein
MPPGTSPKKAVLSATLLYVGPCVDVNRAGTVSGLTGNQYTLVDLAGSYDLGNGVTPMRESTICSIGTTKIRSASSNRGSGYLPVYGSPLTRRAWEANHEREA